MRCVELAERLCRRTESFDGYGEADNLLECRDARTSCQRTVMVRADSAVRGRLSRLDAAIRRTLAEAHAAGKARGESIVMQTGAGEL